RRLREASRAAPYRAVAARRGAGAERRRRHPRARPALRSHPAASDDPARSRLSLTQCLIEPTVQLLHLLSQLRVASDQSVGVGMSHVEVRPRKLLGELRLLLFESRDLLGETRGIHSILSISTVAALCGLRLGDRPLLRHRANRRWRRGVARGFLVGL